MAMNRSGSLRDMHRPRQLSAVASRVGGLVALAAAFLSLALVAASFVPA